MHEKSAEDDGLGDRSLSKSRGLRIAIIGGGFGGIAAAHYLRQSKLDNFLVFETSSGPGGAWNDNRYPGAEVDVVSHLYCFTFNRHDWSQRYGSQKELKHYLDQTVDDLDLRPHFRFGATVASVVWSDVGNGYTVSFSDERQAEFDAVICCIGSLNIPLIPPGIDIDAFPGIAFHSSRWRDGSPLDDKRIGVIGTGASAVQIVAEAAKVARSVTVFQRSPTWVLPKRNRAFTAGQRARYGKAWQYRYKSLKEFARHERMRIFGKLDREGSGTNRFLRAVAQTHLEHSLAGRPDLMESLKPDFAYGAKRPVASDAYYLAMRQENVSLAPAVARLDADGLLDERGRRHDLDVVILATGFRAADYLSRLKVTGRTGLDLHRIWGGEPAAFLGSCVPGFPNFFMINGPNSLSGTQIFILECQAQFAARCIAAMARKGASRVEVKQSAFDSFNDCIQARLEGSVYKTTRNNYASPSGRIVTHWPFSATRFWWIAKTARRRSMTIN